MSKDTITTIIGAFGAAATAAQPVINSTNGSLHQGDYFQLAASILWAALGYFSNKK